MLFDAILLQAVLREMEPWLPCRLDRVGEDDHQNCVLVCRGRQGGFAILLSTHRDFYRLHTVSAQPAKPTRGPLAQLALHLASGDLLAVRQLAGDRVAAFDLALPDRLGERQPHTLVLECFGPRANLLLLDKQRRIIWLWYQRGHAVGDVYDLPEEPDDEGRLQRLLQSPLMTRLPEEKRQAVRCFLHRACPPQPTRYGKGFPVAAYPLPVLPGGVPRPSLSQALTEAYQALEAEAALEETRRSLQKRLEHLLEASRRRLAKQEEEWVSTGDPDIWRRMGEIILAHAWQLPSGAEECRAEHWEDGRTYRIELDPALPPPENARRYFSRYQKARRRLEKLAPELQRSRREVRFLEDLLAQVELADELPALMALYRELEEVLGEQRPLAHGLKAASVPPYRFRTSGGVEVLVGRNMRQNDEITFGIARSDDYWVHVKDYPGSHVLVRSTHPSEADILEACLLAAYFSKARDGSHVPVDVTRRRFVKKPKGAPPGYVVYERQRTYFVTPSGPRLQALLAQLHTEAHQDPT